MIDSDSASDDDNNSPDVERESANTNSADIDSGDEGFEDSTNQIFTKNSYGKLIKILRSK